MGIASPLFFSSNDTEKQTLHRRITPNDEQFKQQQARWNELADHLTADLKSRSGCQIRTWLQGSYKYGTQVRPSCMAEEFDIDLGIFFCWSGQPETGPYNPDVLCGAVHASALAYAGNNDAVRSVDTPPKPRCVRVHYDGSFHIDIPCYHLDPNADRRTLATGAGWEVSDPKALYLWFKDQFDDTARAKVRRQVRYLKCWAALKWRIGNGRPSSVLLTVLAAQAFILLDNDQIGGDDDTLLGVLRQISTRVRRGAKIRNPVNPSEDFNRLTESEWDNFCNGIDEFVKIADAACDANSEIEAADQWAKAFAHFFPMPAHAPNTILAKSASLVPVIQPEVMVNAVARNNQHLKYSGVNKIGPIPKDCTIAFKLVNPHNFPAGTTIEWVVRNEGDEAENINDLGHKAGASITASEHSAYVGTHYMDCILRHSGHVISARRIPVTITGITAPRRNPIQQPAYTRIAGRR